MNKYFLIIAALFFSTLALAQDEGSYVYGETTSNTPENTTSKGFDWDRVTIGGGIGLSFGSVTYIEVSPNFGYFLTDNILAGIGANYTYYSYSDKATNGSASFSTSTYGGRIFGEYIFDNIPVLAHAELELINLEFNDNTRKNIVNPYIGGGLKQSFGGHSYLFILVLWNLNETKESLAIQSNPVIRGGIAIGL